MSRAISMDDSYFKVFFPSKKTVGGRSQYTAANPKSDFEYDELIRSFLEELWQEYEHSDLEDVSSKDRIKIIKQALLNDFYERNKTKASSYVVKFLMNDRFIDHLKHLKLVRNQDSKAEVLYDILLGQDDEADTIVDQFFNATSHFEHAAKIKTALTSEDTVFQSTMDNDSYFRPFLTKVRPNSYAILSPSLLEVNAYCNIIIEFFHKISFRYHLNIGKIRGDYEYTEEAHNAQ